MGQISKPWSLSIAKRSRDQWSHSTQTGGNVCK